MLYLIGYQAAGINHVKIGIAANPAQRLCQLQTGNEHRLSILRTLDCPSPRATEQALHRQFRHYRQAGEWFSLDNQRLELLAELLDRL